MRGVVRRLLTIGSVLAISLAAIVPVTAQTDDTVVVTGSIVDAPLSITISNDSVGFGNIDYKASAQAQPASAQGFVVAGNNGAQWISNSPVTVSITSPVTWSATACVVSRSGLPASGLYLLGSMPASASDANTMFVSANTPIPGTCSTQLTWTTNNSPGDQTLTKYLGTWVQSTDAKGSFTATVRFSVSGG